MQTVIARIWFESGLVETRPVDWVELVTPCQDSLPDLEMLSKRVEGDREVFIANAKKVQAIQLYRGEFTPKRDFSSKRGSGHGKRDR